jgi:hypothetical protein
MIIRNNLSGKKFNRLTVIEPIKRKTGERTKYNCSCECGKEVVIEGSKIKNGHTKSCGCLKKEADYGTRSRLPEGIASRSALIYNYKYNSKVKGINFELTDEEMIKMFESDCHYCGREPYMVSHKKNTNGGYIYTGIDRLDNDKEIGYTTKNTAPCCTKCNYIKNKLNHNEFLDWVSEVYSNLKNKGAL